MGSEELEVVLKCVRCGGCGHSKEGCEERVVMKLFGVRIYENEEEEKKKGRDHEEMMKKSFSVENLLASAAEHAVADRGYLSDGGGRSSRRDGHGRKKGVPWTEEEHRTFLLGLNKLGKGDWRGISRKFVTTRTPTQVASHAQKYFLRQAATNKKKRRSSLFDMPVEGPNALSSTRSASAMAAPRLEMPQASTMASSSGSTNTHLMSYRERFPDWMLRQSEARFIPTMAVGHSAVFAREGYRFQPYRNFPAPPPSPPSIIINNAWNRTVPTCIAKPTRESGESSSSTVNTELNLTISPPDSSKILNGASKMGSGAISVV
ncbi:hypothetical protein Sjap_004523 [Stephania japonica]|uniref:Uncharacterized protein n=1 Tax=Stephania japonica TaxID=461633 RepID=A0AAP0K3E4_9MAGN